MLFKLNKYNLNNMFTIKINTYKYFPLLLFSFFPYITPYSFGTDIQPWSILLVSLMTLLMLFSNIKIQSYIYYLWLPFLFSFMLFFISPETKSAVRSILGYLTIGLVPYVFYYILKNHYSLFEKFIKVSTVVYFFVGLAQLIINEKFMLFAVNRMTSSENRGITSLSVEPTFYGMICLFLLLIFITLNIKNSKKYIYLLLIQIIFFSQSTMTILLMIVYGFYYFLFKMNLKVVLTSFFFFAVTLTAIVNTDIINQDIRFFNVLRMLISNPSEIISRDASINFRLADIYFPIKGFIDNYMLPNGFNTYQTYLVSELAQQSTFSGNDGWVTKSNRISSFYSSILFELGIVGLIIPIIYSLIILKAYRYQTRNALINLFFINTMLITAIPLSFTFVGIYMSSLIYRANTQGL